MPCQARCPLRTEGKHGGAVMVLVSRRMPPFVSPWQLELMLIIAEHNSGYRLTKGRGNATPSSVMND
eukprot:7277764-Alexandrium_andersonii.AAC.1